MKCRHKYTGIGGVSCHCYRCGEYKHKKEVFVKKTRQDRIFRIGGGLLLIGIGFVLGMGVLISQIGGGWEHRIEFVENSISAMSRPRIITKEITNEIITEMPGHRHKFWTGEVIILDKPSSN